VNLLQRYEQEVPRVIQQYAQATGAYEDAPYWGLTLDYGKKIGRMGLEWCDGALKRLEGIGKTELIQKKSVSIPKQRRKE
jgi:hypothetical protein